jgi:prolyl-tRNA editing enzyme YbaK/EbsC (Cys-tRNA(Pro) deacylase)
MHDNPRVASVVAAAERAGLAISVRRFPDGTRTAAEAAASIGCSVAQIVKSLVFIADGRPVVALLSGVDRLDADRLGSALGASAVRRANAAEVRAATGFAIGGIPPIGHAQPLTVLMDRRLLVFDVVWAAAGLPDASFAVDPQALLRASGATLADVAELADSAEG